jgi:hypothetical protein
MSTRRSFIQSCAALALPGLPGLHAAPATPRTRWQISAEKKQQLAKDVVWTTHEPLEFLLRRGDHFDDEPSRYARMYDPENFQLMAAAGVRAARLYFYKGFGLEFERANMEKDIRAAAELHRLGIKVSLYMAGTMFTETLYREVPEARNWEQRDQNNQWVPYGIQTYRHYACPNEPAYREYLKRILKIGIMDVHADEIAFDNLMLQPEPKSCRCPRCIQAFHEFLRRRYPTREAALRRFGYPDTEWIRVNEWESAEQPESLTALNDPVLQEWVRFRCESLANYTIDLAGYVKSLNPKVAVHCNIKGVYSFNRYWTNAVYQPLFAGHVDVISFDTGGYDARLDSRTGALVSQIRSYKMARGMKSSCDESLAGELRPVVHMALGYQTSVDGYPGAPWYPGANNLFTPILEFFREYNDRFYRGAGNVADVAVIRTWPSMAYSISAAYIPATLMEQVLIQHRIPFDMLFEEQIDGIARYPVVILAGQECVSDVQSETLLHYVRNGGTLIVAGNTAVYNQWRERRRTNPLLPARKEGKGRIVYIPQILRAARTTRAQGGDQDPEPGATLRRGERMNPADWVLPSNHEEIYRAVLDCLPDGPSFTIEAPLTTVAELVTLPATRETIAHVINFDSRHGLPPFRVSLRKQFEGSVKSVTCYSPDNDDPVAVKFEESGSQVRLEAPETRLYAMIVVAQ